jgi:hypothetical protein
MKRLIAFFLSLALALHAQGASLMINSYYVAANSGTTGATPAPSLTGSPTLIASWDFGDSSKLTLSGSKITTINGSDGTSYGLSQGTDATRPTTVTLAGYGAAQFSGAQALTIASSLGRSTSDIISVVVVGEMSSLATNGTFFTLSNSNNTGNYGRHRLQINSGTSGFQYRQADSLNTRVASFGTAYPLGRHLVVGTGALNGGTIRVYKDSASSPGTFSSDFGVIGSSLVRATVGADQDGDFCNCYVWRVLVYAGALTSTNVTELASWANGYWGIGTTSSSVGSATLTWNAPSDTTGITGYKVYWSQTRGGTDYSASVSGASTLTYTASSLTTGTWYFTLRTVSSNGEGADVYLGQKSVS